MLGCIYLIKLDSGKVIPAICLEHHSSYCLFSQIVSASKEDIFNAQSQKAMINQNKGKPDNDKIKIRGKYEINSIYIGKPNGLKDKSIVLVKRNFKVTEKNLIKKIAEVNELVVSDCLALSKEIDKRNKLQKEMHILKKKIKLAEINNEKYSHYELRIDEILKELGYPLSKKKKKGAYQNYREVPNKGFIKTYLGGRGR
ncbi:hypothetical protein [Evansella tamaricis]|uniref:Uncharacterized protein n=1 Tax=Evansella tamaricis TaxID=2069301 RepID=A0ABS6JAA1_9BACI|nr:hypothetical protein [Evansella tamaricis]MBU9710545.1 hypothetical protein [Evansella tamaricis]